MNIKDWPYRYIVTVEDTTEEMSEIDSLFDILPDMFGEDEYPGDIHYGYGDPGEIIVNFEKKAAAENFYNNITRNHFKLHFYTKITEKKLRESNPITNKLPEELNDFLMDMAQMFMPQLSYSDIVNYNYTKKDIAELYRIMKNCEGHDGDEEYVLNVAAPAIGRIFSNEEDDDYDDTYEGYLKYCHNTNGEPYSREEWEEITGIRESEDPVANYINNISPEKYGSGYENYRQFCKDMGSKPLSKEAFDYLEDDEDDEDYAYFKYLLRKEKVTELDKEEKLELQDLMNKYGDLEELEDPRQLDADRIILSGLGRVIADYGQQQAQEQPAHE